MLTDAPNLAVPAAHRRAYTGVAYVPSARFGCTQCCRGAYLGNADLSASSGNYIASLVVRWCRGTGKEYCHLWQILLRAELLFKAFPGKLVLGEFGQQHWAFQGESCIQGGVIKVVSVSTVGQKCV